MENQLYRLKEMLMLKNILSLVKSNKINKYDANEISNLLNIHPVYEDYYNYANCTHWEQIDIDSEHIDQIMDTSYGFGNEPPQIIKKSGMAISYGIIVFYWDQIEEKEYYLITQRRDSIPFADFIRGRYKLEYLPRYFSLMTEQERNIIKQYKFDDIWNDMHIINKADIKHEQRARKSWQKLLSNNIIELLNSTPCNVRETEWEFPKGRRMKDEDIIKCALREFEEESNIDKSNLILLKRHKPFIDIFYGSNDKLYQTVYFPAIIKRKIIPEKQYINNIIRHSFVSQEISDLKWVTFSDLYYYLDSRKYNLIKNEFRPWIYENITNNGFMKCGIRKTDNYKFRLTI